MAEIFTELHESGSGRVALKLRGCLDAQSTATCWKELEAKLSNKQVSQLEVDVSQLELTGGTGAVLLRYLEAGRMTPQANVSLHGLTKQNEAVLETFTSEDLDGPRPAAGKHSLVREVGASGRKFGQELREQIAFLGSLATAMPVAIVRPKRMRWREVRRVMETAGANALPVVGAISALVGVVTVLEAAKPLEKFGAQIFLADMVGFSSIRETGPVVTAILLAGRSGSAFAAELGTMKVNQELDALTTFGMSPMRFLVVQRVVASMLLTVLLTLYAMLVGILGGMAVMRSLGFPPAMIFHQILGRVGLEDLVYGLSKSLIFGFIVGAAACLRGLQTGTGPHAVGLASTRSVVSSILLIILADTLIAAVMYFAR